MRYPASEKLEIIRLVERSHLSIRRTLDKLGIPSTTFYRWYDRYRALGGGGRAPRPPRSQVASRPLTVLSWPARTLPGSSPRTSRSMVA
jgi:transposase-like protein